MGRTSAWRWRKFTATLPKESQTVTIPPPAQPGAEGWDQLHLRGVVRLRATRTIIQPPGHEGVILDLGELSGPLTFRQTAHKDERQVALLFPLFDRL